MTVQGNTPLTPRQIECIKWASLGKTAKETGLIIGLMDHSVERRLKYAAEKVGVNNKTALVAKALRERWID